MMLAGHAYRIMSNPFILTEQDEQGGAQFEVKFEVF